MPQPRTRVIAVANQKGGVGKSTTAVSLGAALAELGKKVLVVDLDPQGNASTGLGIRHEARKVTVYDVLAAEAPIDGAIIESPVPNLFAIPSTIDLAGAEIELVSQFSRELRLRKAIEPLKRSDFDFILLDCPPSLGLLTVNALAAAEELIVPIQCEYYALEGLGQLLRNVRLVQQNVNSKLRLTGIVMTMYDPRTKLSEQVVQEVRRFFGDRVYRTIIPRTVRLSEAPGFGQPITHYDPRSRGAQSYRDLAGEVVAKLPDEAPLPVIEDLPTVVVPAPEPEPARAPRPLVEEEDEAVEIVPAVGDPEPEVDLRLDVGVGRSNAPPPAETDGSGAGAMEADAEAEVEGSMPDDPRGGVEPEPQAEAPSTERAAEGEAPSTERAAEGEAPSTERAAEGEAHAHPEGVRRGLGTGPEAARVTLVDDEDAQAEDAGDGDGEPAPKRRWGLFRRGGDR